MCFVRAAARESNSNPTTFTRAGRKTSSPDSRNLDNTQQRVGDSAGKEFEKKGVGGFASWGECR
jgi:hypothetical protein